MKCERCDGTGLIEYTGGTHATGYVIRGELVTQLTEATPEKPVYKRCGCREKRVPVVVRTFGEQT